MDKVLLSLAKEYAEALVTCYSAEPGDANRVPQERRDAQEALRIAQARLSQRAGELAHLRQMYQHFAG